jgi:predicted RNA-binding protein with PUA-like domain
MARWLFKEEPDHYNYANLEKEGQTIWDGVANNQALLHLRKVVKGDQVLCYHTGEEKAIVGVMETVSDPYPDPKESDAKLVVVDVRPVRRLARPVILAEIKADPAFADWELVRNSRLSVMPVTAAVWKRIETLSRQAR